MFRFAKSKWIVWTAIAILLLAIVFGDVLLTQVDGQAYRFGPEHITLGLRTMTLTRESDNATVMAIVIPASLDLHQLGMQNHVHLIWRWGLVPVLTAW